MIGYSFEYHSTLGDVGTGRWQRSDQSVSSTTSTEKVIGRARTLKGVVDEAANGRRKSRASVGGAQYLFVWQLVELSKAVCSMLLVFLSPFLARALHLRSQLHC